MSVMSADELFAYLPEFDFVEKDTGKVEASMINLYEKVAKKTLYPGDPTRVFITVLSVILAQRNVQQDDVGKQNLLRYARGAKLEHLGALLRVDRLEASAAVTTMEFGLGEPASAALVYPTGTRVTVNSELFWSIDRPAILNPGETSVEVPATCLTAGAVGNGFLPGQISRLVDRLPGGVNALVTNVTASEGGTERESDDALRYRIYLAPERFSTAGPTLAYKFWAMSARSDIYDVHPHSPTPGIVDVYVLKAVEKTIRKADGTIEKAWTGGVPDPDGPQIADVDAILSDDKIRPLTDMVRVMPVKEVPHDYYLRYYLTNDQVNFTGQYEKNIIEAVDRYEVWQSAKSGRDINPDELRRACRMAGVKRIEPFRMVEGEEVPLGHTVLEAHQIASIADNPARIQFGGFEDE